MEIPLLQTKKWQKLQQDFKKTTFFEQNDDFVYLAVLEITPAGNYLYCPYGPVAENLTSFKKALKSLSELAKQNSAFFIRIEPRNAKIAEFLRNTANFTTSTIKKAIKTTDLNPADTWILDLTDGEILKKLPSRLYRYYKNREKSNISIETSKTPSDIKHLVNLQKNLASTKKINTFSENYLKIELEQDFATLYLVKSDKKVLAAGLVFDDDITRYNLQGAQSDEGAKLHATGILTIQLILDAAAKNLQKFDFWGISPDDAPADHPWAGFTKFKKSFGGYPVHYCGTWDLVLHPAKYRGYQILRKLNRLKRKI